MGESFLERLLDVSWSGFNSQELSSLLGSRGDLRGQKWEWLPQQRLHLKLPEFLPVA